MTDPIISKWYSDLGKRARLLKPNSVEHMRKIQLKSAKARQRNRRLLKKKQKHDQQNNNNTEGSITNS